MAKSAKPDLLKFIDSLIDQGESLIQSRKGATLVKSAATANWYPRIRTLMNFLGRYTIPWAHVLQKTSASLCTASDLRKIVGCLRAIREAVESGLLVRVEDLMLAETIGDLLEQANHLAGNGYHLAAGVLGRAVLEEHLRKLCDRNGCLPAGRPTIDTLNQALYKAKHLGKVEMQPPFRTSPWRFL